MEIINPGFNFSASMLKGYQACPYAWALKNIVGFKLNIVSIPGIIGTVVHKIQQILYLNLLNGNYNVKLWQERSANIVIDEIHKYNNSLRKTIVQYDVLDDDFYMQHEINVNNFVLTGINSSVLAAIIKMEELKEAHKLICEPAQINGKPAVEHMFSFNYKVKTNERVFNLRLLGFIDLIIIRDGFCDVIDWKTGRPGDSESQVDMYGFVLNKFYGFDKIRMYYVYSNNESVKGFSYDRSSQKYLLKKFKPILNELVEIDYPNVDENVLQRFSKKKSWLCQFCSAKCENNKNSYLTKKYDDRKIKINGFIV